MMNKNRTIFLECPAISDLQTTTGLWQLRVYTDNENRKEHVALIKGTLSPNASTLIRMHSECMTGDVLGSLHCDCGSQLRSAMQRIDKEGAGILLYLPQEGRDIGLANKVRAYYLQHTQGLDTVEANRALGLPDDNRDYTVAAAILSDLGVERVRLLTNNPDKVAALESLGIDVVERVSHEIAPNAIDEQYLKTKRDKMGHLLENV